MSLKIYHNPKCSKSRQTLALIQERGIDPEVIEYLKEPIKPNELKDILTKLGFKPSDILRKKEAEEEGLSHNFQDEALIEAICACPRTLQRPIVVNGQKAVVGRPPEKVLEIL